MVSIDNTSFLKPISPTDNEGLEWFSFPIFRSLFLIACPLSDLNGMMYASVYSGYCEFGRAFFTDVIMYYKELKLWKIFSIFIKDVIITDLEFSTKKFPTLCLIF